MVVERGIQFDFSAAQHWEKHDRDDKNRVWPGVDFEIEEASGNWIWLEVKSWDPARIDVRRRGGQANKFLHQIQGDVFFKELRQKFLGTCAFLALNKSHPATSIHYVVLIESPRLTPVRMQIANSRLKHLMPAAIKGTPWPVPLSVAVMRLQDWNDLYPEYPAQL